MDGWLAVLVAIGSNAVVLAVLGFLGKAFVETLLEREQKRYDSKLQLDQKRFESELERSSKQFEHDLKAKSDLAMEQLRAQLQIAAKEHEVTFSRLDAQRGKAIAELYGKAAELERATTKFLRAYYGDKKAVRGRLEEVWRTGQDFRQFLSKNRIYFNETTCQKIDAFDETISSMVTDLAIYFQYRTEYDTSKVSDEEQKAMEDRNFEDWEKAFASLTKSLPSVRAALEADFRQLLGVHRA